MIFISQKKLRIIQHKSNIKAVFRPPYFFEKKVSKKPFTPNFFNLKHILKTRKAAKARQVSKQGIEEKILKKSKQFFFSIIHLYWV